MTNEDDKKNKPRSRGRPLKNAGPSVPWDQVDMLLVHGEATEEGGVVYPGYREIAERYSVAHSMIAKYAKHHNCLTRRKQAKKRMQEMADEKLSELRADKLAISKDDTLRIIDRFVAQFEEALKEGRVRCDNPTDYNTMMRLRSYIQGDADARAELVGGLSLEEIERLHKETADSWDRSSPKIRGEVVKLPAANPDGTDKKKNAAN